MKYFKNIITLALAIFFIQNSFAQKSLTYQNIEHEFNKAIELYNLNKFGAARDYFEKIMKITKNKATHLYDEAEFYTAICAKELENDDAKYLLEKFIQNHPESYKKSDVYYNLGDIQLSHKRYSSALKYFNKINNRLLDKKYKDESTFKIGYCLFMNKKNNEAEKYFKKLKNNTSSKYYESSNYYYAHIMYEKGNYNETLNTFNKIKDTSFKNVIPFYIAQIYYLKKDYDKAIEYAYPLINKGTKTRNTDMLRIVGYSYFAKKQYLKSIDFLEKTINSSKEPRREDYYYLGFAYYYKKNYDKAADYLSMVTSANDELSQNAYYHLADCYIKLNDKKRARLTFEAASKYNFNTNIQENALFNTIKLNYELNYSPFNEIINSLMDFINKFPNSKNIDDAYNYLSNVFLSTKNYKDALEALEKIKIKNNKVNKAFQRVAYFRAIDLYTNLNFSEAKNFFLLSLKNSEYNKELKTRSYYWIAECEYRMHNYNNAIDYYNKFISQPNAYTTNLYPLAFYNIAYAYFKTKQYETAKGKWTQFVNKKTNENSAIIGDAYNRIGDCYYVQRNFENAINYYKKASKITTAAPDYSMMQMAKSMGILKQYNKKIEILNNLINKYPTSHYVDDALFETGKSYLAIGDLKNAIYKYKTIKEKYPESSYAKKAMLQLGLVYYNSNQYDNSMAFYKRVINEFPNTPESIEALKGIRNIYMDRNKLNEYISYANSLGNFARVDAREKDSLSYVTAEKYYMNNNCDKAILYFKNYLKNNPKGMFAVNANYYMGDCLYKKGNKHKALEAFEYVTNNPKNIFSEDALLRSGEIYFADKNYSKAISNFIKLEQIAEIPENTMEAQIGILRCYQQLNDYNNSVTAAEKIINNSQAAPETIREAEFIEAKALMRNNKFDKAIPLFTKLAENTQSSQGAESKYILAQYYYDTNELKKAEDTVFDFANKGTSHNYWLARSFIVLSDVYITKKEYFQAKQYLESIKENYNGNDDIQKTIENKLYKLNNIIKDNEKKKANN